MGLELQIRSPADPPYEMHGFQQLRTWDDHIWRQLRAQFRPYTTMTRPTPTIPEPIQDLFATPRLPDAPQSPSSGTGIAVSNPTVWTHPVPAHSLGLILPPDASQQPLPVPDVAALKKPKDPLYPASQLANPEAALAAFLANRCGRDGRPLMADWTLHRCEQSPAHYYPQNASRSKYCLDA